MTNGIAGGAAAGWWLGGSLRGDRRERLIRFAGGVLEWRRQVGVTEWNLQRE
ncbi:hypothetical protein [Paenibacillus sp. Soil724D2]|uniref:hypothetical protein n=1 Tax=Paenibacillus sp. (strain Soil724D2) TaxID=1736392 RepID=UPI000AB96D7E|nr:hypothetical protein [Paenibacillus sp. Soil724D2]